jgi:multiple sugar transport system ATP-binding protein
LEFASGGTVSVDNARVDGLPPRDRDVAFVFQNYALYPHMSVFENLGFSLRLHGVAQNEIRTRVSDAARLLEIDDLLERKPQQLSGGQRQRVALGRAIVRRPKLFLFDEPLSNLDATLRTSMRVELARLHRRLGCTMIYVTHDQAEAMTLGEKIIVLHQGEIQQIGAPSDIYHRPKNLFVAGFVGQPQMNFFQGRWDGHRLLCDDGGMELDLTRIVPDPAMPAAQTGFTLGVRAEDLRACDAADPWFSGNAEFVEDLGSDRYVHLFSGGVKLVARLSAQHPVRRGDTVHLKADPERLHLFVDGNRVQVSVEKE